MSKTYAEKIIDTLEQASANDVKDMLIACMKEELFTKIVAGHDNGYFDGDNVLADYYIDGLMLPLSNLQSTHLARDSRFAKALDKIYQEKYNTNKVYLCKVEPVRVSEDDIVYSIKEDDKFYNYSVYVEVHQPKENIDHADIYFTECGDFCTKEPMGELVNG